MAVPPIVSRARQAPGPTTSIAHGGSAARGAMGQPPIMSSTAVATPDVSPQRQPLAGVTGTIKPTPAMTPVSRAFQQGYQQGAAKPAAAAKAKPRPKATTKKAATKAADTSVKGYTPSPSGLKPPKKGLAGILERNKSNIQSKALERMKKSGRKG